MMMLARNVLRIDDAKESGVTVTESSIDRRERIGVHIVGEMEVSGLGFSMILLIGVGASLGYADEFIVGRMDPSASRNSESGSSGGK